MGIKALEESILIYHNFKNIIKPIKEWNCYKDNLISLKDFNIIKETNWNPYEKLNFKIRTLLSDKYIKNNSFLYFPLLYALKENFKIIKKVYNESYEEKEDSLESFKQLELLKFTKQFKEDFDFKVVYNLDRLYLLSLLEEIKDFEIPNFIKEDIGVGGLAPVIAPPGDTSGDIATIDTKIIGTNEDNEEDRDLTQQKSRTLNGKPVFEVNHKEFLEFKNGKKFFRWDKHTDNLELKKFARKYPNKSFYVKYKNYFFLVKRNSVVDT